jgi:hypothetical protein
MSVPNLKCVRPANDNRRRHKTLGVAVEISPDLPIQMVEVEVFAQLLDSLSLDAANDNEG